MFIYSAFFVRERMFLCADRQNSVRFADVRKIATRASEFIYGNSQGFEKPRIIVTENNYNNLKITFT